MTDFSVKNPRTYIRDVFSRSCERFAALMKNLYRVLHNPQNEICKNFE